MDDKKNIKSVYDNYENLTKFIYQELSGSDILKKMAR